MGIETVSVVFTDLVGSTELRQRLGEERADALHRSHDWLMTTAVQGAGGQIVKGLGDGVMAVFHSAAAAVTAGVAIQQAVEQHGRQAPDESFSVRIGVSAGDVYVGEDDYQGTAVVEAARLCAKAEGGQILVAELVGELTRGRGGHTFEPVGTLELKGLDERVAACLVPWEPLAAADPRGPVPFPTLLDPPSTTPYVGRPDLLADLRAAWRNTAGGAGSRLVLLAGEPGVGKTRTACMVAREAHAAGALVLYGRCDEAMSLPHQPFVEALDWQSFHDPGLPLGRFAGDMRRLVPDLEQRVPSLPPAIRSEANVEEHRLLEASASWLAQVSRPTGLVLVIDDLHWARPATLQMLLHTVRAMGADPDARVLMLATYRDTDVDRAHPLFNVLGQLGQLPGVGRRSVDPLTESEVVDFLSKIAGHDLDDDARTLARRAHADTEGNPFFLGELLRHFVDTGVVQFGAGRWSVMLPERVDVPEGVRDVIGRRLNRLGEHANQILRAAALVGREFSLEVVGHVVGRDLDATLDALDNALAAQVIDELDGGLFRFGHSLIQQVLYDELSATRRRRLHAQVVRALEDLRPTDLAGLAHHSVQAAPSGPAIATSVRYLLAAGEQAVARGAREDARTYFIQVLELSEQTSEVDLEDLLQARCGLGEVQRDGGDPEYRETLLSTTDAALEAGLTDVAVRAAVATSRMMPSLIGITDPERAQRIDAVLAHLGQDRARDRSLLLAALAAELTTTPGSTEHRLALVDEAVSIAAELGDPRLEAHVLAQTLMPSLVPARLESMRGHLDRLLRAADASGDPTLRVFGHLMRSLHLQFLGELDGARASLLHGSDLAADKGVPRMQQFQADYLGLRLIVETGNLGRVRDGLHQLLAFGLELGMPDAPFIAGSFEAVLLHAEGTFEVLAEQVGMAADWLPDFPLMRIWQAYALAETKRVDEAWTVLQQHGLDTADGVPLDMATLASWMILGRTTQLLEQPDLARSLAAVIEPHQHRWATAGPWLYGPMTLPMAVILPVLGYHQRAAHLAREAWEATLAAQLLCSIPATATWLIPVLRDTGNSAELILAEEIAQRALAEAKALGMDRRAAELVALQDTLPDR